MADLPLREGERMFAVRNLPACLKAPGEAREWSADALARWGVPYLADDMQMVAGELVTNSVQAGAKAITVLMEWHRRHDLVEVRVWDDGPGEPQPQAPDFITERGRGLFLVEQLSAKWGHHPARDGGKVVWAQFELKDAR
jgi:anti-sigma regulatory factor (Ser/Thr protein kinase)